MTEPIEDSVGTRQRAMQRRRSRTYGSPGVGVRDEPPPEAASEGTAVAPEQGDYMQAEPYLPPAASSSAISQRGQHGEGAGTVGNSVRGPLSGGLTGATATREGQQGGIGASAYDIEPTVVDTEELSDPPDRERDLTVGEAYGGTMEQPGSDA